VERIALTWDLPKMPRRSTSSFGSRSALRKGVSPGRNSVTRFLPRSKGDDRGVSDQRDDHERINLASLRHSQPRRPTSSSHSSHCQTCWMATDIWWRVTLTPRTNRSPSGGEKRLRPCSHRRVSVLKSFLLSKSDTPIHTSTRFRGNSRAIYPTDGVGAGTDGFLDDRDTVRS